ncbi:PqqD family protein [Anaerotignum sp.]|uniref:PqqD family protein n=1 Tax=Anaerotignum sp. TaxID=2039241 RepID=UPI002A916071|nr:PqqD family protein [Anaerotignum sp.]MCI7657437.1 PqqD family protein [Clostridia bacterium]MDY5414533.1 PqqD family protein [Anaerotignum sp.]
MKKKNKAPQINYLDMIPSHNIKDWQTSEDGVVTLMVENSGLFHSIAQKVFKKPKYTQVHLDATGSFLWPRMDGIKSVAELALEVKAEFGEAAEPLYPRIAKYFQILESYHFVKITPKSGT